MLNFIQQNAFLCLHVLVYGNLKNITSADKIPQIIWVNKQETIQIFFSLTLNKLLTAEFAGLLSKKSHGKG